MSRDSAGTRRRIMDVAERLIIEQGFSGTSVGQVIAASASSKGAFFHHFDSKAGLAAALVDRYVAADLAHLEAGLAAAAAHQDPQDRVLAFLRHYEDGADDLMAEQSGCLYAAVLAERELTGSEVNRRVAAAEQAWRDAFADLLRAALAAAPRRDLPDEQVDPDALASHLFVTFEGGFVLCRTAGEAGAMRAQLTVFRQLVHALLSPSSPPPPPSPAPAAMS